MENDEILNTIIFLAQEAKLAMQDDDFGTGGFWESPRIHSTIDARVNVKQNLNKIRKLCSTINFEQYRKR